MRAILEDPSELAARAEEERVRARRDGLAAHARQQRTRWAALRAQLDEQSPRRERQAALAKALDTDIADVT